MDYTPEELREKAASAASFLNGMDRYHRAHADALEKLKVAEEALDLALMGMDQATKEGGESFIGYALTADKLRLVLARIRGTNA